jgi:hypothetical protein
MTDAAFDLDAASKAIEELHSFLADHQEIVSVQGVGRAGWSFEPGQPLTAA